MPTLVNNLRAIRGPVTAVPMVGASGVVVEPDTANNQVVVRADETVLWDGNNTPSASITLSEPISNFSLIRLTFRAWDRNICIFKDTIDTGTNSLQCSVSWAQDNGIVTIGYVYGYNNSTKTITKGSGLAYRISGNAFQTQNTGDEHCGIVKVVGVHRIAG